MKKLIQQTNTILIVLLFVWHGSSVIAQCNHPDDYTALRALYLSTDGDNWTNKTGWPTRAQFLANPTPFAGIDMSEWYAVTCDGDRVQVLYLIENNLIGKIPVEIGNLTFVLHLSLFNNQLEGYIPVEIGNLSLLKYLSLANNQLIGNIPKEFGNLLSLEILSLTSNKISGNIPKEIGSLLKLNSLSLDFNQLSGNIPVEIKNLKKLNILNLDSNKLTGSIPKELGDLSELGILKLGSNQFSGIIPKELGMMTNLNLLWLYNNRLSGNIPKELGNLINLVNLLLYDNQLTGNLPIELGKLYNLNILQIFRNEISGNIPKELGNLTNLSILLLWSNNINGNIPKELGSLRNLTQLSLSYNKLTGDIPKELGNLNKLNHLSISNNKLSGRIPGELSSLNLYYLHLNNNNLDGCIDYQFKRLCDSIFVDDLNNPGELVKIKSNVNFLYNPKLSWKGDFALFCNSDGSQQAQIGAPCENGNPADGTNDVIQDDCSCGLLPPCNHPDYAPIMELYNSTNGPNWINNTGWAEGAAGTNCDPCNGWYGVACENGRVKYIDLDGNANFGGYQPIQPNGNNLTGYLFIGKMDSLIFLNLNFNKIGDTIPGHLFQNLKNLKFLSVAVNQITGIIPKEISEMNKIENINLSINQISGFIPKEIGDLRSLKILGLSLNQISGVIPKELGKLENLELLYLDRNKLTGEIPTEFKSLKKLVSIELFVNELSGEIPKELAELPKFKYLFLAYNKFTGNVHNNFFYSDSLKIFSAPFNNLSGCFNDTIFYKFCTNPNVTLNLNNNPLLPWQGDFSKFCAVQGNQQAQIGAPCNNGNPADGENDVIQDDCSCGLLPPCNHPDFAPLLALYNSTNGPGWTNKTGWEDGASGTNCDPCNGWYGVQCENGRVDSINLFSTI
jgi:Leucine-rich repeat (LRR) protein